jgi:hypothetical protein
MGYGTPKIRGYDVDVTTVCVTRCVTFPIITPPWPETTEKRLDLTGYMSYNDAGYSDLTRYTRLGPSYLNIEDMCLVRTLPLGSCSQPRVSNRGPSVPGY